MTVSSSDIGNDGQQLVSGDFVLLNSPEFVPSQLWIYGSNSSGGVRLSWIVDTDNSGSIGSSRRRGR